MLHNHYEISTYWASKMAQQVKALEVKPDEMSSIPRNHMVKVENPTPTGFL